VKILENYDKYTLAFNDIIKGYSKSYNFNCYLKHLGQNDLSEIEIKKQEYELELKKEGVFTEKEKLEYLKKEGLWTDSDEEQILTLKYVISDNKKIMDEMVAESQKKFYAKILEQKKIELKEVENRKFNLLYPTAEHYSVQYYSNTLIKSIFFKDKELSIPLFSEEEFSDFDDEKVNDLNKEYAEINSNFTDKKLSLLACLPLIINQLSYCKKNLRLFLDKPITQYTNYQMSLVNKTIRNLNVLENTTSSSPEIMDDTSEKDLIDWYDLNYSIWQGKLSGNSSGEAIKKSTNYVNR